MTTTDDARLLEIEAREQAATAGPWFVGFRGFEGYAASVMAHWPDGSDGGPIIGEVAQGVDCEFIAHSREDVRFLLDRLKAAESRIREIEGALCHRSQSTPRSR